MKKKIIINSIVLFFLLFCNLSAAGVFRYEKLINGINCEIKIMSLGGVQVDQLKGATHHLLARFNHFISKREIKDATVQLTIITPLGTQQIHDLKNYNGLFAANLCFKDKGKYEISCVIVVEGTRYEYAFDYIVKAPF